MFASEKRVCLSLATPTASLILGFSCPVTISCKVCFGSLQKQYWYFFYNLKKMWIEVKGYFAYSSWPELPFKLPSIHAVNRWREILETSSCTHLHQQVLHYIPEGLMTRYMSHFLHFTSRRWQACSVSGNTCLHHKCCACEKYIKEYVQSLGYSKNAPDKTLSGTLASRKILKSNQKEFLELS